MIDPIFVERLPKAPFYTVKGLPVKLGDRIKSFFELWLAREFSQRTIRAYAFDLIIFFRFYRGKKKALPTFKNININVLNDFILHERARNAAPRSINRRINTIDVFYRHCYNKLIPGTKSIASDPTSMRTRRYLTMDSSLGIYPIYKKSARTFRVKVPHQLIKALEPGEVNNFLTSLKSHRDQAIILTMLLCGLRSMEVLNLKLEDFNTLSKTLRLHGKGNKERDVPIPDSVCEKLERYIEVERPIRRGFERERKIFLNMKGPKRGLPMCAEGLRALFRYKRMVSGITHANPHRFRHTCGRNLVKAGMSLSSLQKLLGHNDIRTTAKYVNLLMADVFDDFSNVQKNLPKLNSEGSSHS